MRIEEEEEKERRNGQFKRLFSKEGIKESGVAKSFRQGDCILRSGAPPLRELCSLKEAGVTFKNTSPVKEHFFVDFCSGISVVVE